MFQFYRHYLISGLSGEVFEKIGRYTHRVCWKIPWHWNLETGNVSNRDTLGVQKGKAVEITHIMTVTKNLKQIWPEGDNYFKGGFSLNFNALQDCCLENLKNRTFFFIACIVYLGAQSYRLFLFWSNILTCLFHHHHSGAIKILTVLRKKTKDVGATVPV